MIRCPSPGWQGAGGLKLCDAGPPPVCHATGPDARPRKGEVINAGIVGEWQYGDQPRDDPVPVLALLLVDADCPHAHAHRLAAGFMAASGAAALDMVVMPDAGDAADHPAENQAE